MPLSLTFIEIGSLNVRKDIMLNSFQYKVLMIMAMEKFKFETLIINLTFGRVGFLTQDQSHSWQYIQGHI